MNVWILGGVRSKCKPKTQLHNLTCAEYSSVAGFDDIRGIKFFFETLQIGQTGFRRSVRGILQDEDYVGEGSLKFMFAEEKFSPHACYLGRWVAKSKTHTKRPNA